MSWWPDRNQYKLAYRGAAIGVVIGLVALARLLYYQGLTLPVAVLSARVVVTLAVVLFLFGALLDETVMPWTRRGDASRTRWTYAVLLVIVAVVAYRFWRF